MKQEKKQELNSSGFGTLPVYFTAISTILGAILFLRFGVAVGTLGFWGAIGIILLGHLITIPTALAISEIATNTRVEGGGEYFIISRSFGLKIGSTIGITLFFSQVISVAFYIIAFTEAFVPFFDWWQNRFGYELPRQVISVPSLVILALLILKKGAGVGMKMLYIVNIMLFLALLLFFMGSPIDPGEDLTRLPGNNFGFFNREHFFILFAICFPAFTGMTAGVGLSGDLKNPGKSIPLGTMGATITGLIVYILVVWKLSVSSSQADLLEDQLIMARIAIFGSLVIPLGLAACTSSSALSSILVAPRTLQALAMDNSFPIRRLNLFLSRGKGKSNEPYNATLVSFLIALGFVMLGSINMVAEIISMFFLITYGVLCLISFLNHFGSPPSYRPRFKSKWFFSLGGFLLSVWVMFMINPFYTILSYVLLIIIYIIIEHYNKAEKGLVDIFEGALFQLNRRLRVFMQKHQSSIENEEWRPSAICISPNSFERDKVLELMKWISHQHGFGTYFHYIEGYYSKQTYTESQEILRQLVELQKENESALYIDTMISPSYTSAIAQVIQTPSISGMENNMVIFEFDKNHPEELNRILDNINLARAGNFDVCIFASSTYPIRNKNGIHVWIRDTDEKNTNLMILLGYIILAHHDWRKSKIKIFITSSKANVELAKEELQERIANGRLPITLANIEIVMLSEHQTVSEAIRDHSKHAGLTLIGFREEMIKHNAGEFFTDFQDIGDVLFVNASQSKEIN
ncbi:amino acid transporter [Parabacteroides sp. PF5-5]|uniref:amino acid permease n=1 Tax=unclassified Parabacteroides TaxID=2649774 RepID=UPI0024771F21|nr:MULTISPECIES: amino acid permease [unclassified Parabacteroides]MDH6303935.1 amino acid transporter [Parabacteroides sp. PH5-39]MDH6314552.1 amino acid transporter [Parabacteroides sp. PF5-13]MDH6318383.1 amino acid transporter [Parabacteroides sp. PH5-13]MDH6322324.1 amino acid transporter [Parabacteroides sp. PH5-8]MDH6325596.1 amino acid transporter [Parabacteroides sp. PH5-41]